MPTLTCSLTERELSTWRSWVLASRTFETHVERLLTEHTGLALVDYELLDSLAHAEEPMRMCDLGASVALTRSGMTRAVTRLENMGLVERRKSDTDGRSTVVGVTDEGRDRHEQATQVFVPELRQNVLGALTDDEQDGLRIASELIRTTTMGTPACRTQLSELLDA